VAVLPAPFNMTAEPLVTVWSGPAFAVGGVGCVYEIGTQTPFCSMEFASQIPFVVVDVGTHKPLAESNVKPEAHIELAVPNPLVIVVVVVPQPNCGKHGNPVPPAVAPFANVDCPNWFCANRPHISACGPVATPALTALQNIEAIVPIICAFAIVVIVGRNPAPISRIAAIRE
jgi:hypothetical protein